MARKEKKSGCLKTLLSLLIIVEICLLIFYFKSDDWLLGKRDKNDVDLGSRVNILVLGHDEDGTEGTSQRSDTIILLSADLEHNHISLISIPRDSRVDIPGYRKKDKINHSFSKGGIDLTKETVENLLGKPIDYYMITDFQGFKEIIDVLGGVDIDVEKRMYHKTYDGVIDIKPGVQHMDGDTALQYVRFRSDGMGDIGRTERQQKFLKALFAEVQDGKNIIKIPALIPKVMDMIETDMTSTQLIALASKMLEINSSSIENHTLPGDFATISGISYWEVDEAKTKELIDDIYSYGETENENIDNDISSSKDKR